MRVISRSIFVFVLLAVLVMSAAGCASPQQAEGPKVVKVLAM